MKKAGTRRAAPPWSLPTELWLSMISWPKRSGKGWNRRCRGERNISVAQLHINERCAGGGLQNIVGTAGLAPQLRSRHTEGARRKQQTQIVACIAPIWIIMVQGQVQEARECPLTSVGTWVLEGQKQSRSDNRGKCCCRATGEEEDLGGNRTA